jgi:hypothetical protein
MCPVSRGAFFGIRVPRLKNENHERCAVRRWARLRSLCMVLLLGTTTRHSAHGAGRCEVGELPGLELPSSVLGGLNRYVTHLFDHIASDGRRIPLQHVHTHRGPAFTRWRSLNRADERNPGLPIPHRAGGLTRHIYSYIRTEIRIELQGKHDFLLHATLQVQRSRQIVSSIHATT